MKRLIIVDDDPAIRDIFELILKRAGYELTIYSSGDVLLRNEFATPNLFIIDKMLSGVDGVEVCKFLKQNNSTREIPVIVTSASPHAAREAIEAGADAFIEKPFKARQLISLIEKHLVA